jgi:hypothetical protein
MAYQSDQDEVYYCGKCNRQQQPLEGTKCKICSSVTVSWHTNKESVAIVLKRWKSVNGIV